MNILAILTIIPAKGKKGFQTMAYDRLLYLAKQGHKITVICFEGRNQHEDARDKQILNDIGIEVNLVKWSALEAGVNAISAFLFGKLPLQCAIYKSKKLEKTIIQISEDIKPDIIYCVLIRVLENLKTINKKPFIDMVDSMSLNLERRIALSNPLFRWFLKIERKRVLSFEKIIADRSVRSFVVSNIDRKSIDSINIDVIPLGIDEEDFYKSAISIKDPIIVFAGNMDYPPNLDAISWFIKHCWKQIKQTVPNTRLIIAGNNPTSYINSLQKHDASIEIKSNVRSMSDVLREASISIAPMQSGSGMQRKILESMACGIPVVATTLGLGDIQAIPGTEILIRNSPTSFTEAILQLIRSPQLRTEIGDSGFKLVRRRYTREAVGSNLEKRLSQYAWKE